VAQLLKGKPTMTTLNDAQVRHAQFTEKHQEAKQEAATAQSALNAAQNARIAILDAVAAGAQGKTTKDLVAADEAIRNAQHEAELRDSLEQASKRAKDRAQVEVWEAAAADIKNRLRAACAEQIEVGRELDDALKAAAEVIERFNGLSLKISALTHEAHNHDQSVLTEGAGVTALGAHQSTWPRTRVQSHQSQQPVFVKLHQEARGWPVRDVHSAEELARGHRSHFGPNLNA
jgi:hypothetical protein